LRLHSRIHYTKGITNVLDVDNLDLSAWAATPFPGNASMITAMRHPQYRSNVEYRDAVEKKVGLMTSNTFTATVYVDAEREVTETGAPASAKEAHNTEVQTAQQALLENYGEHAVKPADMRTTMAAAQRAAETALAQQYGPGAIRPASPRVKVATHGDDT
jgi:hypothetical protein